MRQTTPLYYGPGAQEAAIRRGRKEGRFIEEPTPHWGNKVGEAREIVSLMWTAPVGEHKGVLVVGPFDFATPQASDCLLKTIEEPSEENILILWAEDLGGISSTIKSRCNLIWSPGTGKETSDQVDEVAGQILTLLVSGRVGGIPDLVWSLKGEVGPLVSELSRNLVTYPDMWEVLRPVTLSQNPSALEVISALISIPSRKGSTGLLPVKVNVLEGITPPGR